MRPRAAMLLMLGALAGSARAQDAEIGSRLKPRERPSIVHSRNEAAAEVREMAECLVHRRPGEARAFLNATDAENVRRAQQVLFRDITCTPGSRASESATETRYAAAADIERGLVAEALIHRDFETATPPVLPIGRVYQSAWSPVARRAPVIEEMATCVAAVDPTGIKALLATAAESAAEQQAIKAMSPSLARCLASNAKLSANMPSLRAALAEELYHRMAAPAVGAPSPR